MCAGLDRMPCLISEAPSVEKQLSSLTMSPVDLAAMISIGEEVTMCT